MALLEDSPWAVVMPVKSLARAKSRIDPSAGGLGGTLALAFFQDALAAVLHCPRVGRVVVATGDARIGEIALDEGCVVVDDAGHPGINAAAAWAARREGIDGPVAVLVSDLPCLTSADLTTILDAALGPPTSFMPDAGGTGTTMWLTTEGLLIDTRFGPDSASAHRSAGCADLALTLGDSIRTARRDVDTEADLVDAIHIGIGSHTRVAWEAISAGSLVMTAISGATGGRVDVVDEDGGRHQVAWSALADAGFREIRPGQRVVVTADLSRVVGLP